MQLHFLGQLKFLPLSAPKTHDEHNSPAAPVHTHRKRNSDHAPAKQNRKQHGEDQADADGRCDRDCGGEFHVTGCAQTLAQGISERKCNRVKDIVNQDEPKNELLCFVCNRIKVQDKWCQHKNQSVPGDGKHE